MGTSRDDLSVAERLRDIVLDSSDVTEFLEELALYSAQEAPGIGQLPLQCAVTLHRHHRPLAGAGSDERARKFEQIQQEHGEGPCLEALATGHTVVVEDTESDPRWPEYAQELHALHIRSVLAIPLVLEDGASASMNFFSPVEAAFSIEFIERATRYASHAEKSLRVAVRIGSSAQAASDLEEAMKSRTAIDIAVGVIMGQQRCSQKDAFALLVKASAGRNQKLRQVAETLVANLNRHPVETHFDL